MELLLCDGTPGPPQVLSRIAEPGLPLPRTGATAPLPLHFFPTPSQKVRIHVVFRSENVGIWCPLVATVRLTVGESKRDLPNGNGHSGQLAV